MKSITSVIFLIVLINYSAIAEETENKKLQRFYKDLQDLSYNPNIPPPTKNGEPLEVLATMYLLDIHKIDDFNMEYRASFYFRQSWNDTRLKYEYFDTNVVTLHDVNKIWLPDLFFIEEREGIKHDIVKSNAFVKIRSNGEVKYSIRVTMTFGCRMDFRSFPHDTQKCAFSVESYGNSRDILYLNWDNRASKPVGKNDLITVLSFKLTDIQPSAEDQHFQMATYRRLLITLTFERNFGFFLIRLYLPFIFFVILSWLSFWIEPKRIFIRLAFLLVILYFIINMRIEMNSKIPPAPYTKASDVWIATCETLVFCTFLEYIFVKILEKSEKKNEKNHCAIENEYEHRIEADDLKKENTSKSDGSAIRKIAFRLSKTSKLSTLIDRVASIVFPFLFLVFNIIYWSIY